MMPLAWGEGVSRAFLQTKAVRAGVAPDEAGIEARIDAAFWSLEYVPYRRV